MATTGDPGAASVVFATSLPCYMANNSTLNSQEQCKFVIDNDCLELEAIVDYVSLVYCDFGTEARRLAITLIGALICILFMAMAVVADDFLCPNLLAVARNLRMSDSLAGVTLLAFGNGCPDIFSSLAAASDDRAELIVGELLGGGIFCTSVIAGLVFIYSDFKIATRPILRDTTFYLLAIYLVWTYCYTERITFYRSLAFIVIYVIYLMVALGGQVIHARLRGAYTIGAAEASNQTTASSTAPNDMAGSDNKSTGALQALDPASWNSAKGVALERVAPLDSQEDHWLRKTTVSGRSCHQMDMKPPSKPGYKSQPAPNQISQISSLVRSSPPSYDSHAHSGGTRKQHPTNKHETLELNLDALSNHGSIGGRRSYASAELALHCDSKPDAASECEKLLRHLSPIDPEAWSQAGWLGRLVAVLRAPLVFLALATTPVVDFGKPSHNWCRPLTALHCLTIPPIMVSFAGLNQNSNLYLFGAIPPAITSLVLGLLAAIVIIWQTTAHHKPGWHSKVAYFGFIMSVAWVYLLAREVIGLLKTVGVVFGMTDAAIGLGILAWGNSLGDFVANTSLAQAGYPRMALGASVGAPLLNLLLGFGLSFTISLGWPSEASNGSPPSRGYSIIQYSPTITLLCVTLSLILITLMCSTLWPAHCSKRPLGYMLITGYAVYLLLAVCIEYSLIKF